MRNENAHGVCYGSDHFSGEQDTFTTVSKMRLFVNLLIAQKNGVHNSRKML